MNWTWLPDQDQSSILSMETAYPKAQTEEGEVHFLRVALACGILCGTWDLIIMGGDQWNIMVDPVIMTGPCQGEVQVPIVSVIILLISKGILVHYSEVQGADHMTTTRHLLVPIPTTLTTDRAQ